MLLTGGLVMRSPSGPTCKVVTVIARAARRPTAPLLLRLLCFLNLPDGEISLLCSPPPNPAHHFLSPFGADT